MKFALKIVKNRFLFFNVNAKPVYFGKHYLTPYFNYTEIKPQKISLILTAATTLIVILNGFSLLSCLKKFLK